jgi:hypothetical protein
VVHDEGPEDEGARPSSPAAAVRASDREREEVARALRRAGADGRLTLDETDQRIGAAYAARFRHELDPLTADLPAPAGTAPPTGWVAVWHGVLRQSRATLLGVPPDVSAAPTRRHEVIGALAALAVLLWLALWILIGFGVGVIG